MMCVVWEFFAGAGKTQYNAAGSLIALCLNDLSKYEEVDRNCEGLTEYEWRLDISKKASRCEKK